MSWSPSGVRRTIVLCVDGLPRWVAEGEEAAGSPSSPLPHQFKEAHREGSGL